MSQQTKQIRRIKPNIKKSILLETAIQFSKKTRPNASEVGIFRDLFYSLVSKVPYGDLKAISASLAGHIHTPRPVAMYLAMEPLDIASPMLLNSPVLTETNLRGIMEKRPVAYAEVIERRKSLSPSISKHIAEIKQKPENDPEAQPKANIILKAKAISETELARDKQQTNQTNDVSGDSPIDRSEELIALANRAGKLERRKPQPTIRMEDKRFGEVLLEYLKVGDQSGFVANIAGNLNVHETVIANLISERDIGKMASLFRALDIQPLVGVRLLLMYSPELGRDGEIFKQVMSMYKELDINKCRARFVNIGASFSSDRRPKETVENEQHLSKLLVERRNSFHTQQNRQSVPAAETRHNKPFGRRTSG